MAHRLCRDSFTPPTGWWFLGHGPGHVHEWYSQKTQPHLMTWHDAGCSGLEEIGLEPHQGLSELILVNSMQFASWSLKLYEVGRLYLSVELSHVRFCM